MAIYKLPNEERGKLMPLAADWQETMIWSCIQGHMGAAYADCVEQPKSAQFVVADFCFFAGEANRSLVENRQAIPSDFTIMVPQHKGWEAMITEVYPHNSRKVTRYAMKKETDLFDKKKLQQIVEHLEPVYEIKPIEETIYEIAMQETWSADLCSQFADAVDYRKRGIGMAVFCKNRLVAGASSYTLYDGGIEIEIDTRQDFRRKGLAYAVGAKLILECLDRGLYPSWDAHNKGSAALAEKLGYHFDYAYTAYEVEWESEKRTSASLEKIYQDIGQFAKELDADKVELFGSRARGDNQKRRGDSV